MAPFLPLTEPQLNALDDDGLIEYLRRARATGRNDADARLALQILVYGHWHNVLRRVLLKVPARYAEDVTSEVLFSAIRAAFDGQSVGEFVIWLRTITDRRIADFFRRGTHATVPLDDESSAIVVEAPADGTVEVQDAIDRVLARLGDEHRRVIEIVVFEDKPASVAVAEIDNMSENNVHQIAARFRKALKAELEGSADAEEAARHG